MRDLKGIIFYLAYLSFSIIAAASYIYHLDNLNEPSSSPTRIPISRPSSIPTSAPSSQPSCLPTTQPSRRPTRDPSSHPSRLPTAQPSRRPSRQPSSKPSHIPSSQPSTFPSMHPSRQPTEKPSNRPSIEPSITPTWKPSENPTMQPSVYPSKIPVRVPTSIPSTIPSLRPSSQPTGIPTIVPSSQPTVYPSSHPSSQPSSKPTTRPTTSQPTSHPSSRPSLSPVYQSHIPTVKGFTNTPTSQPSARPTYNILSFQNTKLYKLYNSIYDQMMTLVNPNINYYSYSYKGKIFGLQEWREFTSKTILLPTDEYHFASANVSFGYQDFYHHNHILLQSYQCYDTIVLHNIVKALQSSSSFTADCNGNVWRVYYCPLIGVVFCVNCKVSCSDTSCPGNSLSTINPNRLDCSPQYASFQFMQIVVEPTPNYPIITSSLFIQNINESNVSIIFNTSGLGTVYCAAIPSSQVLVSVEQLQTIGGSLVLGNIVISTQSITMILSNLIPSTHYYLYCGTESLTKQHMPVSQIESQRVPFITKCCNMLQFDTSNPKVILFLESSSLDTFTLRFESSPQENIRVAVYFKPISEASGILTCPSVADYKTLPLASPNTSFVGPNNLNAPVFSIENILSAGCYMMIAEAFSDNTGSSYAKSVSELAIVPHIQEFPSLQIAQAIFSSDGIYVYIYFDYDTDRGVTIVRESPFICSLLFSFTSSEQALCRFVNDALVKVEYILPISPMVEKVQINREITLLSGVIRRKCVYKNTLICESMPFSQSTTVLISAPNSINEVQASLVTSYLINPCDDLILDATGSEGHGGRYWKQIEWQVSCDTPLGSNTTAGIILQEYLNLHFINSTAMIFHIPNIVLLHSNCSYTITMMLTNFMNSFSLTSSKVSIEEGSFKPSVVILGNPIRSIHSNEPLLLSTNVSISKCIMDNISTNTSLKFSWSLFEEVNLLPITSASSNPREFQLLPNTLLSGKRYFVQLLVCFISPSILEYQAFKGDHLKYSSLYVTTIVVESSNPVSFIQGGDSLEVSYAEMEDHVVDGSSSFDPDDDQLLFIWSCQTVSIPIFSSCPFVIPNANSSLWSLPYREMKQLSLTTVIQISLTVVSRSRSWRKSSITYQLISFNQKTAPSILILTSPYSYFSSNDVIALNASISYLHSISMNVSLSWNCSGFLQTSAATPLSMRNVLLESSSFPLIFPLVIKPSSLTPGNTYAFRLFVTQLDASQETPWSASEIVINLYPQAVGGSLEISPDIGFEFNRFTFKALGWFASSEEYPLNFVFSYYIQYPYEDVVYISTRSESPNLSDVLVGRGLELNNYQVYGVVDVLNSYGISNSATKVITVFPRSLSQSISTSIAEVSTMLSLSLRLVDRNSIMQLLSFASGVVSSYNNCVGVSASTCLASLNRNPCSIVPHNCGACLDGYSSTISMEYGLDKCISLTASIGIGMPCSQSSECITSVCDSGICSSNSTLKTCPNNCHHNGKCIYKNVRGDYVNICINSDINCFAICECNSIDFANLDCSYNISYFRSWKSTMCSTLDFLSRTIDSKKSLEKWEINVYIRVIVYVFQNINDITTNSALLCISSHLNVIKSNINSLVSQDSLYSDVLYSLDVILKYHHSDLVVLTILDLVKVRQRSMALGQMDVSLLQLDSFRLSTIKLLESELMLQQLQVLIPQSPLEKLMQVPNDKILLSLQPLDLQSQESANPSSVFAITVLQFRTNPLNLLNITSSNIEIIISTFSRTNTQLLIAKALLHNYQPIEYFRQDVQNKSLRCLPNSKSSNHSIECLNIHPFETKKYEVQCPGDFYFGFINATCPRYQTLARVSSTSNQSSCNVEYYNTSNTMISCEYYYDIVPITLPSAYLQSKSSITSSRRLTINSTTTSNTSDSNQDFLDLHLGTYVGFEISSFQTSLNILGQHENFQHSHDLIVYIFLSLLLLLLIIILLRNIQIDSRIVTKRCDIYSLSNKKSRTFDSFYDSVLPEELKLLVSSPSLSHGFLRFIQQKSLYYNSFMTLDSKLESNELTSVSLNLLQLWNRISSFVFISIVLFYFIALDNGYCESMIDISHCDDTNEVYRIDVMVVGRCVWNSYYSSCTYQLVESYFIFLWILLIITIIPIVSYLLISIKNYLLMLFYVSFYHHVNTLALIPKVSISEGIEEEYGDEFIAQQKPRTILLLGARLDYLLNHVDYVRVKEEYETLYNKCRFILQQQMKAYDGLQLWYPHDVQHEYMIKHGKGRLKVIFECLNEHGYDFYDVNHRLESPSDLCTSLTDASRYELIIKKLTNCRSQALNIISLVNRIYDTTKDETYDAELFLVRTFLCNCIGGYQRDVAKWFLLKYPLDSLEANSKILSQSIQMNTLLAIFFQIPYLLFCIFEISIMFYLGLQLGAKTTWLWLISILVIIIEDASIVSSICILIRHVLLPNLIIESIFELTQMLRVRSRGILRRSFPIMKYKHSLIQHFNASCRAARSLAHLPIARILISLTDFDLPYHIMRRISPYYIDPLEQQVEKMKQETDMIPKISSGHANSPLWKDHINETIKILKSLIGWLKRQVDNVIGLIKRLFVCQLMTLSKNTQDLMIQIIVLMSSNGIIALIATLAYFHITILLSIVIVAMGLLTVYYIVTVYQHHIPISNERVFYLTKIVQSQQKHVLKQIVKKKHIHENESDLVWNDIVQMDKIFAHNIPIIKERRFRRKVVPSSLTSTTREDNLHDKKEELREKFRNPIPQSPSKPVSIDIAEPWSPVALRSMKTLKYSSKLSTRKKQPKDQSSSLFVTRRTSILDGLNKETFK